MRKFLASTVLITLLVVLSACGTDADEAIYYSIQNHNLEGLIENIEAYPETDLNNLSRADSSPFRNKDNRALGIALGDDAGPDILKYLIKSGRVDVDNDDDYKYITYVMCNCEDCYAELAEEMLARGADLNGEEESTLAEFIRYVNPQDIYVEDRIDFMINHGAKADNEIVDAVMGNEFKYVYIDSFIKHIDGLDEILKNYDEGLYYAVTGNDQSLLEYLSEENEISTETILFASGNCNVNTLQKIKEAGYSFDVKDEIGWTPLMAASATGDIENIEYLLSEGLDLSYYYEDFYKANCLDVAVAAGNVENVRYIMSKGIKGTYTTWLFAINLSDSRIVNELIENGYSPSDSDLCDAFVSGSDEVVCSLLEKGYSPDTECEEGPAIDYVDSEERLLLYLEHGCSVSGDTLENAVELRAYDAIEKILEKDNLELEPSLILATQIGDIKSVKMLVNAGADINKLCDTGTDDEKEAAIHAAAYGTSSHILEYYINNGADLTLEDSDGYTPGQLADEYASKEMRKLLK